MGEHRTMRPPSLWLPEPDRVTLLALGKLAEEAGELAARANRCIIQGIDAIDPDTGQSNAEELAKEVADVRGLSALLIEIRALDESFIQERADAKRAHKLRWLSDVAALGPADPVPAASAAPVEE